MHARMFSCHLIMYCIEYIQKIHYTTFDLCRGGHGVLLNSKRHTDQRVAEISMIKFTVQ